MTYIGRIRYGFDDLDDYTWEGEQNLNDALWHYDGYEEHVLPKLNKKEVDANNAKREPKKKVAKKAGKAKPAAAKAKAEPAAKAGGSKDLLHKQAKKSSASKAGSSAAGGKKRKAAELEEAEEPSGNARAAGGLPIKGARVEVDFSDQGYVGSVLKVEKKKKKKKFLVHFDADDEEVWVQHGVHTWRDSGALS